MWRSEKREARSEKVASAHCHFAPWLDSICLPKERGQYRPTAFSDLGLYDFRQPLLSYKLFHGHQCLPELLRDARGQRLYRHRS